MQNMGAKPTSKLEERPARSWPQPQDKAKTDRDIPEELLVFYQAIRSEVNFLLLPFFALDDKEVRLRKELEFCIATERDGKRIEIKWSVSANSKFGYPGPFDKKVHKHKFFTGPR